MQVNTISILGTGLMGTGIAHVSAVAGFHTIVYDVNKNILERSRHQIETNLQKGIELGKLSQEQKEAALANLSFTLDRDEVARCEFLIEAVPENIELKIKIFSEWDALVPAGVVFATNTSGLSVTEMAAVTSRPQRFIGMHFFNPVHKMKLIEIIRGLETSDETFHLTESVGKRMGKETVSVRESPGFVTSRMNALIGNEAFYMLQEGIASAQDIDKAIKLGLNHPMGPFEMVDLVGLDTRLSILQYLHRTLGEKYRPCPLLIHYVNAGRLGRKVGKGVYDYTTEAQKS